MPFGNITATCCGQTLRAPGLAVECTKCRTVFQIRQMPEGNLVITTTPFQMRRRARGSRRLRAALSRLPIVGLFIHPPVEVARAVPPSAVSVSTEVT